MRHAKYGGKLSRTSAHRKAMLRNMVTSLLDHERVETTDAKAKDGHVYTSDAADDPARG